MNEQRLYEDPSDAIRWLYRHRPTPWRVAIVERDDRWVSKKNPGKRFAIVDALGNEVRLHGSGQAIMHLIVDAVNSKMVD